MNESYVGGRGEARFGSECCEVPEPLVDHPSLRVHTQVVDRELLEGPTPPAIGSAPDLEDERLAAFPWERAKVVIQVVHEFEVHEGLGGGRDPPALLIGGDAAWPYRLAAVAVHGYHGVQRSRVFPIQAEEDRRGPRVIPSRHAGRVRRGTKLGVHAGQDREIRQLDRDLRLRGMPGEIAVGLHVRPELRHGRDREHAPLGALGPQAADPCAGAGDDAREVFVAGPHIRIGWHAREPFPAPIAAGGALPPRAAGHVRGRWCESL